MHYYDFDEIINEYVVGNKMLIIVRYILPLTVGTLKCNKWFFKRPLNKFMFTNKN